VAHASPSTAPMKMPSDTRSNKRSSRGAGIRNDNRREPMFIESLFRDQVALITGGGTGLGLAIAERLGSLGARVVIASRSAEHLASGRTALEARGIEVATVPVDIRQPDQVDAMVARAIERFGRVDILVNNAAGNFI